MTTLSNRISLAFLKDLVATPRGRALLLSQVADAEAEGESGVFERLAALTRSDPLLCKMISRHAADEVAHASAINARIDALGVARPMLPESLNMVRTLQAEVGVFARPLTTRADVMRAYLFLQMLEERVIGQLANFIEALRPVDAKTAELFESIRRDEQRHLLYCYAISTRYAPSLDELDRTLRLYRRAEAGVFARNGAVSMRFMVSQGVLDDRPIRSWLWKTVAVVACWLTARQYEPTFSYRTPTLRRPRIEPIKALVADQNQSG